ncbi:MAG: hypothetical protein DMF68_04950 [Acidobacteria bacterium]|nr:MAG: hypothetical protein DMF68_04950 [Acidobacteriota bacterium]
MQTEEIRHDEWSKFFDSFSREHAGWLATIEIIGTDVGAQEEASDLPLVGITADLKGTGKNSISIIVGEAADDHITHTITEPASVRFEKAEGVGEESLQIETSGGATTLLRLRASGLPERIEGSVPELAERKTSSGS